MQSFGRQKFLKVAALVVILGLLGWVMVKVFISGKEGQQTVGLTGLEAIQVPEGFTVEQVAGPELASYAMFGTLDERGRLFLCESTAPNTMSTEEMLRNPSYQIRLLEDVDGDGIYDKSKVFADRIPLPQGALWYRGSLYVAASPDFLRFDDTDDDGVSDRREVILTGWTLNVNAAVLHGPFFGPDGWLYLTDARRAYKIKTQEGTVLEGKGARIWRCRADGTGLEWVSAGGFDNPVELVFTPAGEIIGTMTYFTNPKQGQRDALMHWVEGGVYPKPHRVIRDDQLKRTGDLMPVMTKFPRIAPAGLILYRGASFGPEYQDNLFSAQFNPHRVQRHTVFREGSSFRTEDEDFLTSVDPGFHPTDLIEDVDGSLLVIDTGGWFIKGCPVSIEPKAEIHGAIYRIRKKDVPRIEDPRGQELKLETHPSAELVQYLEDPRPAVRDKAVELLVEAGEAAVDPLAGVLKSVSSPEVRCAALFGLFRIGTPKAQQAIRAALNDADFQVRVAAARVVGMAKDRKSINRLMEMVQDDEPAVRRQAATALGQIADKRAVAALLAASANPEDRFVEHSIIYALITLKDPAPVTQALQNPSSKVRKAALIALDQMDGGPLGRHQLRPLLGDEDKELRHAALWVASHHPDWSGEVLAFLRTRLRASELSAEETEAVGEVLVSFCQDSDVQAMVTQLLGDGSIGSKRKLFLLETMDRCSLKELPESWIQRIGEQLQDSDLMLRSRALALIRSRQIGEWGDALERMAADEAEPADLRTAALEALVVSHPRLSESQFRFLLGQLRAETQGPLRLSAARVLGRAQLSDPQQLVLARQYLSQVDPLILSSLLEAFRDNSNEEVGEALVAALTESFQGLHTFHTAGLEELLEGFPDTVQRLAKPLRERLRKVRVARIERLQEMESQLNGGDIGRGRKIFFGQKAACSSCHTIGMEGTEVGPDLTSVGAVRSRHDLLEAIIFPSASFVRGHEVYRVETANETYSGIRGEQTRDAVVLITGPDSKVRIPRDKIVSMQPSIVSLMPEGLDETLTRAELTDLVAFLQGLQ